MKYEYALNVNVVSTRIIKCELELFVDIYLNPSHISNTANPGHTRRGVWQINVMGNLLMLKIITERLISPLQVAY